MKVFQPPQTLPDGTIEAAHEVEAVCLHCGYDLDEAELAADTCSDCGKALELKQNVAIQVTTLPPMFGSVM
jgi:transcription initiation factor IIE alpha subunit